MTDAALERFARSLQQVSPPAASSPALRGVWHALRGEWHAAHDAVQPETSDCAWVHAALHREEGDHANAAWWYRCAGRAVARGDSRSEYLAIAAELLTDPGGAE